MQSIVSVTGCTADANYCPRCGSTGIIFRPVEGVHACDNCEGEYYIVEGDNCLPEDEEEQP